MIFSLPEYPSYYDTKNVNDYIDSQNTDLLYLFLNNQHVNLFILSMEQIYTEYNNFNGFITVINEDIEGIFSFKCQPYFFENSENLHNILNISSKIEETVNRFFRGISTITSENIVDNMNFFLEYSGIKHFQNKDNKYSGYHEIFEHGASQGMNKEYYAFIHNLNPENSKIYLDNNIYVNGNIVNKISLTIADFKENLNNIELASMWIDLYQEYSFIMNIIQYFENIECEYFLFESLGEKPVYYVKNEYSFDFLTNKPVKLEQNDLDSLIRIDRKYDYEQFSYLFSFQYIEEESDFNTFVYSALSEKEKKILNFSLIDKPSCILKRQRI